MNFFQCGITQSNQNRAIYFLASPQEQISNASSEEHLFVSVYNGKKMIAVNLVPCYEFRDKEKPQDALVALVQLHYR